MGATDRRPSDGRLGQQVDVLERERRREREQSNDTQVKVRGLFIRIIILIINVLLIAHWDRP